MDTIPFEQEDPEFGELVFFFINQLSGNKKSRHPIVYINKWANESGAGRNDPCPCGSGKKFKRCCINL